MARDAGYGLAGDAREQVGSVALDSGDDGDRQPGWINAVDAGGHQLVAVLEIRIERNELELELPVVAGSAEHRAQPIAQILHRPRLLPVGDQRDLREPRINTSHLTDKTDLVDHRPAGDRPDRSYRSDRKSTRLNSS